MQPLEFLVPVGALESVAPYLGWVALVVVLANMATRLLAHKAHRRQADAGEDDEELSRHVPHAVTTVALVLVSFAFMVVEPHGGMVLSVLVLGAVLADFFEFEARKVEARNGMELEKPKAALTASLLVLAYAAYQSVFVIVEPLWSAVV